MGTGRCDGFPQGVVPAGGGAGRRPTVLIADGMGLVLVLLRLELEKRGVFDGARV